MDVESPGISSDLGGIDDEAPTLNRPQWITIGATRFFRNGLSIFLECLAVRNHNTGHIFRDLFQKRFSKPAGTGFEAG